MNWTLSRILLSVAFVLALLVVGTSSGLRLMNNGLGCGPWPTCYGAAATAEIAQQSLVAKALRLTHRVAASAFALVALAGVLSGWRRWDVQAQGAAVFVLATTAVLSLVGLATPSPLPAVTLINLLGGLALLGGTAFMLATTPLQTAVHTRGPTRALAAILVLVAIQAAAGAMISVRSAGAACDRGCGAQWQPGTIELWNPLRPGPAEELLRGARAGEPLHALHRLGGIVITVLATALLGAELARSGTATSRRALAAVTICLSLGLLLSSSDGALSLAVAHALSAGLLVASLAMLLAGASAGRSGR